MPTSIAIIGSAGIPNRYGGFESFAEQIAPCLAARGHRVTVTCDKARYPDNRDLWFEGVQRMFVGVPANGTWSPLHDAVAFLRVAASARIVLVLGVSGGLFFPLMRLACALSNRRLVVNIDGVEWRRVKFGRAKRAYLFLSDWLAQRFAHRVIYDNEALRPFVRHARKSHCVAYSGDHAAGDQDAVTPVSCVGRTFALTVCRIEPENQCQLLIDGFLASRLPLYVFVGNWNASAYGREMKARYANQPRLDLREPIYDAAKLRALRRECSAYLHGHSVGGTNPSLVEMLFFDCPICCFDCSFNRVTAGAAALYFDAATPLAALLDARPAVDAAVRAPVRDRYRAPAIAQALTRALGLSR